MDSKNSPELQNPLISQLTEKNIEGLRRNSNFGSTKSEEKMEKVARDFESVFINKLFESMRKAIPKSDLLNSSSLEMFQQMMDQEMAKEMSKRKGMGMGEMVYNDLSRMNKLLRGETIRPGTSQTPMNQNAGVKQGD
jgi:Rod binding domain-containing protein